MSKNLKSKIYLADYSELDKWVLPKKFLMNLKTPPGWKLYKVKEFASKIELKEPVLEDKEYKLAGVKWYGEGVFHRETVKGNAISAKWLNPLIPGSFIYNRLFAWKESFSIVPDEFGDLFVSNEFPQFKVDNNIVYPEYLYLIFIQKPFIDLVTALSSGSAAVSRNRFKEEEFLDFDVPLPPLDIQARIINNYKKVKTSVDKIEEGISRIEKDIENYLYDELNVSRERNIKKGPFIIDFKDIERWDVEINSTSSVTLKNAKYDWVKLKSFCTLSQYGYIGSATKVNTGVKFLRITDIDYYGEYDYEELPYVQIERENIPKYRLDKNDVIIARTGATSGKCTVITEIHEDIVFASYLIRFKLTEDINPLFLEQYLNQGPGKNIVRELVYSSGRPNINANQIQEIRVPLPPLSKQNEIINVINSMRNEAKDLKSLSKRVIENLRVELEEIILGKRVG